MKGWDRRGRGVGMERQGCEVGAAWGSGIGAVMVVK